MHVKIKKQTPEWWILVAIISAIAMIFVDQTVLPLTLPTIQRELNVSDVVLQWTVNSYSLVLTATVLTAGKMGDIFGHRKMFCLGSALFALASAFTGFAMYGWWLILGRCLQGLGGALMAPASLAILMDNFPKRLIGRALGLYMSAGTLFLSIGPFIGGFFTEYITWRLVFWINLPISIIGICLALRFVPRSQKIQETISLVSFLLFAASITALIVAIMQGPDWGWHSPYVLGLFFLSILLFTSFYYVDQRQLHPMFEITFCRPEWMTIFCFGNSTD